ncbi:hypothetical protein FACS1894122_03340 [Alphaproteobacteria bacterium]|nr:hypothetical protein FACS1894122_03340 [Alphaproteobacteria bacterium]
MKRILLVFACFTICGCTHDHEDNGKKQKKANVIIQKKKSKPAPIMAPPVVDKNVKVESEKVQSKVEAVDAAAKSAPKPAIQPDVPADDPPVISMVDETSAFLASSVEEDSPVSDTPIGDYDLIARQLAGLDAEANTAYGMFIETRWKNLNNDSLGAIKNWSQKNIIPHLGDFRTVFYPFGGPDISCPFKFFPSARTYILVGLEPIGSFNEVSKNIKKTETLACLKKAFSSYLQIGFFITSEMSKDLSSSSLNGSLPLILPQLARLGFYVSNIEDLSISPEGKEVSRTQGMTDCVRITCKKDGDSAPRFVYYVRINLADDNRRLPAFVNFMKRRTFVTFLKSASYALHSRTLSKFKAFLLANSQAILQDDTGVPFKDFGEKWQKYVFGHYEAPMVQVFKNYKQPAMVDFYKANSVVSIPFKIGYGFNRCQPNLLLAVVAPRAIAASPPSEGDASDISKAEVVAPQALPDAQVSDMPTAKTEEASSAAQVSDVPAVKSEETPTNMQVEDIQAHDLMKKIGLI